jgi:hypothetical protein
LRLPHYLKTPRLALRRSVQLRVQVQRLSRSNVYLLVELRAPRRSHFDIVAAGPEIDGLDLSNGSGISAIDVYLCVLNVGVQLQRAGRKSVAVVAVRIWKRSPVGRGPSPSETRRDKNANWSCLSRKRRHQGKSVMLIMISFFIAPLLND